MTERSSESHFQVRPLNVRSTFSARLSELVKYEWSVALLVVQPNVWQNSIPSSDPAVDGTPGASGTSRIQACCVFVTVNPSKHGLPLLLVLAMTPTVRSTSLAVVLALL